MIRPWFPNGNANYDPQPLPDDIKSQLRTQLDAKGIDSDHFESFCTALSEAIGCCQCQKVIAKNSTPAKSRENLSKALEAARALEAALRAIDMNSWSLFRGVTDNGFRPLLDTTTRLECWLQEALDKANEYPKQGRLPDYARLWLAKDVAAAIHDHLRITPTTTKEGLYFSVLELILEAIPRERGAVVHKLGTRGLKLWRRENPPKTT